MTSLAFSPDSRRLASGSFDRTVKVWDVDTGEEVRTLIGHTGYVQSVAFSPDDWRLISASNDKTVRIWDATEPTPQERAARRAAFEQQGPAWHRQEAEECEKTGQWFAAAFHLRRLLLIEPDNESLKERLQKTQERLKAPE